MAKFQKKPIVIEAVRITRTITIHTLEGKMIGEPGDWLITGIEGEQYPCKDAIFRKTYTPADSAAAVLLWSSDGHEESFPMGLCNYCSFSAIRRRHRGSGKEITRLPDSGKRGGQNVYVHPKDVVIAELTKKEREPYFAAWFLELTNHCVC